LEEIRGDQPPSGDSIGEDGLDNTKWRLLNEAINAAHNGDADGARAIVLRLASTVPYDGQAGMYLWYMLRYRIADILGRRPSPEDIRQIAAGVNPKFALVMRGDPDLLENTLRTAFRLADNQTEVTAGRFIVASVAALGVLLEDPSMDLQVIRPHLARWWRSNLDKFRSRGVLLDRSIPGSSMN
jgi:hypothetical protein